MTILTKKQACVHVIKGFGKMPPIRVFPYGKISHPFLIQDRRFLYSLRVPHSCILIFTRLLFNEYRYPSGESLIFAGIGHFWETQA